MASTQPEPASPRPGRRKPGTRAGAAHAVVHHDALELHLPFVGSVHLPRPDHVGWYAGVAALAVLEIIDWPVATVLAIGKALSDNHRYHLIEEFGRALDEVA